MALTTAQAFDQFHDRIKPTPAQHLLIASRRKSVAKYLGEYFDSSSNMPLLETRVIGSAARKTIIRPLDDVDVLAVFDDSAVWSTYKKDSKKFLYRVREALSGYSVKVVGARGQAVRLFYDDDPYVDITPVFAVDGDGYNLPSGDGSWLRTDPDENDSYLSSRNADLGNNLLRMSRMLKQWNRAHGGGLRGFHVEVMAACSFETLGRNSREATRFFFANARKVLHTSDPAGHSGDLAAGLSWWSRQLVKDSFDLGFERARKAVALEERGKHNEAIRLWRLVFGEDMFPAHE